MVQPHAELAEDLLRVGEDIVVEVDEHVIDQRAGVAQRLAEIYLGAPVGGEILDQQRARPFADVALDLRIAAEALGLLPHVLHRQAEALGDPGGVGNAGGLAAGDDVELLETDVAHQRRLGEVDELPAHAGIEDQLAAVDVHRARPARGEAEGLVFVEQHRLHFEQHLGGGLGDERLVCGMHGAARFYRRTTRSTPAPGLALKSVTIRYPGDAMALKYLLLAAALALAPLAAHAQSTYRCVSKDGKKYYGSTIPQHTLGQPPG